MYYEPQRKLAFFLPPRTGSTTLRNLFTQWGVINFKSPHPKPSEITIENFDQYTSYGFYREPLDRFLSLLRYARDDFSTDARFISLVGMSHEEFKTLNYDQLTDLIPKYTSFVSFYFDQQTEWLANATCLDFRNYDQEVLRIARMLDVTQVNIARHNWTEESTEVPSQRVIDYVQANYADDYRLGRERGLLT